MSGTESTLQPPDPDSDISLQGVKMSNDDKASWLRKKNFKIGLIRSKKLPAFIKIFTEFFDFSKRKKGTPTLKLETEPDMDNAKAMKVKGFNVSDIEVEEEITHQPETFKTTYDFERLYLGWLDGSSDTSDTRDTRPDNDKRIVKNAMKHLFRFVFSDMMLKDIKELDRFNRRLRIAYTPLTAKEKIPCNDSTMLWTDFKKSLEFRRDAVRQEFHMAKHALGEPTLYGDLKSELYKGLNDLIDAFTMKNNCLTYGVGPSDLDASGEVDTGYMRILEVFRDFTKLRKVGNWRGNKTHEGLQKMLKDFRTPTSDTVTTAQGYYTQLVDLLTWEANQGVLKQQSDKIASLEAEIDDLVMAFAMKIKRDADVKTINEQLQLLQMKLVDIAKIRGIELLDSARLPIDLSKGFPLAHAAMKDEIDRKVTEVTSKLEAEIASLQEQLVGSENLIETLEDEMRALLEIAKRELNLKDISTKLASITAVLELLKRNREKVVTANGSTEGIDIEIKRLELEIQKLINKGSAISPNNRRKMQELELAWHKLQNRRHPDQINIFTGATPHRGGSAQSKIKSLMSKDEEDSQEPQDTLEDQKEESEQKKQDLLESPKSMRNKKVLAQLDTLFPDYEGTLVERIEKISADGHPINIEGPDVIQDFITSKNKELKFRTTSDADRFTKSFLSIFLMELQSPAKHLKKAQLVLNEVGQTNLVQKFMKELVDDMYVDDDDRYTYKPIKNKEAVTALETAFYKHFTGEEFDKSRVAHGKAPEEFREIMDGAYVLSGKSSKSLYGLDEEIELSDEEKATIEKGGIPYGAALFLYLVSIIKP